jgi:hypothetical protein
MVTFVVVFYVVAVELGAGGSASRDAMGKVGFRV